MRDMNIGELARLTGVSTKAIRYYEEIGVLEEPERSANGYRKYRPEAVDRLRFVKDAQVTGLTLAEIGTILEQRSKGESTCEHVMVLLDRHLEELEARIATLTKTRSKLMAIAERAHHLDPADCVDPNRCQTIAPTDDLTRTGSSVASEIHGAPREHSHSH